MMNKTIMRKYADPGLSIPATHGLLHAEQVKYIIRTAVRIIDHRKTLILYIFDRKQVLQGNHTPAMTMFHSNSEYITLDRCDNGKTRWRTATFENLDPRHYFSSDCAFYSQNDEARVSRYFHSSYSGFGALNHAQEQILSERLQKRQRQRDRETIKRMKPIKTLPRGLNQWIRRSVMPAYFFYDSSRKKHITGICSACGQQLTLSDVKHNSKALCPHCGRELTMKSRGRRGYIHDRDTCQVVQRISPNELVARIIKVQHDYYEDNPKEYIFENARIFIRLDEAGKVICDSYYYSYGRHELTNWKLGSRPVFYPYQYNYEADTCGHIYCGNLPDALADTPWQYCPVQQFYEHYRERMQIAPLLEAHIEHPRFEHLVKIGFYELATDLAYRIHDTTILDETQNRTHRILKIAPEDVAFLRELDVGLPTLRTFQKHSQENLKDRQELFLWTKANQVAHDVDKILQNMTVHKFVRYMDKQYGLLHMKQTQYGSLRYSNMQALVSEYRDYLEMCEQERYDMRNSFVLFPKDLQESHDTVAGRIKHKADAKARREFRAIYKRLGHSLDFEHDGMKIVCPVKPKDIVTEGQALHHCVGSYTNRVAKGYCLIVFLRRCNEPGKSFYTIELRNREIVQLKGMGNADATPEVQAFVDLWKKEVLQLKQAA